MAAPADAAIATLAALVEFAGALLVAGYAAVGIGSLLAGRTPVDGARLLVASGALAALNLGVVAAVLRTIELQTVEQIARAGALLALRVLIKHALDAERRRSGAGSSEREEDPPPSIEPNGSVG